MAGKMADAVIEGLQMRAVDEADRAAAQPQAYAPIEEEKPSDVVEPEEGEIDEYLGPSILAKLAEGIGDLNEGN
jgi:hypothetical protein